MKQRIFLLFILTTLCFSINAQPKKQKDKKNLQFGIKIGTDYSQITNLSKILVSESYYTNYQFTNSNQWGGVASVFLNYKFEESISSIQAELSYSRLGNKLHYSDIDSLHYDFILKYEYLNFELFYKAYIFNGLHLGIGPRLGFNMTPGALYYSSNGETRFGPDIRIQQQMRDVLKGRSNFSIGIGIGYEFNMGLTIDARYYYGLSDVVETEVNNFHFIENNNASRSFQFTIGYILPYEFKFFKERH